jgi:four helix bundle protein
MKYSRFEDLPVWKSAIELVECVYRLTRLGLFSQSGNLKDQMRRAALSISNNIAEGFERGTTSELLMFVYIARGSAGEVRSMLRFCERLLADRPPHNPSSPPNSSPNHESEISNFKSEISNLRSEISDPGAEVAALIVLAESCSRQLRGWPDSLQNTDIKRQRHLNDSTPAHFDRKQRASAFQKLIDQKFREAHPELFASPDPEPPG